ncbi:MAG TPA: PEP/pyruvate-binding domain-containing protein [Acidimicrobiales bacterium]|nr:PEP/pyruvate-binding domain-containing protein [Acidimicrobiales bacterium]
MTNAKSSDTTFVIGSQEQHMASQDLVGTKAARLAHLAARGFRVPEGFVVSATACERIGNAKEIPQDIWAAVLSHLKQLEDGPLAVRSSGLAEDLADKSYAGQYATVLGVETHDAVADAIRRCLTSASSEQVRAYRRSYGQAPIAVLVQRMVLAEAAGVAFTANPINGDSEVLVSAVKGLGDRLVSGDSTPDEWVVRGDEVSCTRSPEGALDEDQVREIAGLVQAVEREFGKPQDIEWALADGRIFLLQARPITALPVRPVLDLPTDGFWIKDTSHFPTPLTPFGASVYLPAISDAMRFMIEELGLMCDGVEQRSLAGEVYVRTIPVGGKDRPVPPQWVMWLGARLMPPLRRRARAAEAAITSGLPERILDRWDCEWRPAFANEFRELKDVDLKTLSDEALLAHLDRAKDMLYRGSDIHFQLVAPYYLALYEFGVTCRELFGWDVERALYLVTGASEASSEPGRELASLAQRIAADAAALRAITESDADRRARLRQAAPWAAEALDEYLERFGHRTLNYDPGEPTLFERPDVVMTLLVEQVRRCTSEVHQPSEQQPKPETQYRSALVGHSDEDRDRFERALAYARRAYGQREDNVVWLDSQPCALLRYAAVEIGRRLVDRGLLVDVGDAVFLEEPELHAALSGEETQHLPALVARRKAERAWVSAHPGPASYGKEPGPPPDPSALSALPPALRFVNAAVIQSIQLMFSPSKPQTALHELQGVPGSPGRYSGTVRVIRDQTEFAKLGPGDVLVAPVTSPPWSVLFLQAGAVVTDGGGVLSHTAVIAREYGIPAVLATGEGTSRLSDGDLVTVDGSRGIVTIARADRQ